MSTTQEQQFISFNSFSAAVKKAYNAEQVTMMQQYGYSLETIQENAVKKNGDPPVPAAAPAIEQQTFNYRPADFDLPFDVEKIAAECDQSVMMGSGATGPNFGTGFGIGFGNTVHVNNNFSNNRINMAGGHQSMMGAVPPNNWSVSRGYHQPMTYGYNNFSPGAGYGHTNMVVPGGHPPVNLGYNFAPATGYNTGCGPPVSNFPGGHQHDMNGYEFTAAPLDDNLLFDQFLTPAAYAEVSLASTQDITMPVQGTMNNTEATAFPPVSWKNRLQNQSQNELPVPNFKWPEEEVVIKQEPKDD